MTLEQQGTLKRREVLKAGGAGMVLAAAPSIVRGLDLAKEPVRIAHIGLGVRGGRLISYTGETDSAKVVAVCDVYEPHLKKGAALSNNPEVRTYTDYKKMLDDKTIEAVVISTPDHWHERMLLDAIAAGKDVYCEKGWTTTIAAAKRMRAAVKKSGAVMQLGHQGRQNPAAKEGRRLIEEGVLGEVTLVQTGRYFNAPAEQPPWRWYGSYENFERPDPNQVIKQLDWEKWLGEQEKIDFDDRHFWHWRCYNRYGTGQAGDLLSHEMDYVQSVLRYGIPDTCMTAGLNAFFKDGRESPDTWIANYQWVEKGCTATFEGVMNSERCQYPEFIGRKARMLYSGIGQSAKQFEVFADGKAYTPYRGKPPEPEIFFAPGKEHRQPDHMEDFLQCVRTREKPQCNEDEAFIEAATLIMSVEAYKQKRQVRWDPKKEEII